MAGTFLEGIFGLISALWEQDWSASPEDDDFMGLYDDIFVHQSFSWDCGIATTSMVLLWCQIVDKGIDTAPLQFDDGTPLWTIDLYVFLRSRNVDAVMSTSEKGIAKVHGDISWYREHLEKDRERVNSKFFLAEQNSWRIDDAISTEELAEALADKRYLPKYDDKGREGEDDEKVAIVLVNINNLIPRAGIDQDKYSGHYVLVLSYDPRSEEFIYLDPSKATSATKRVSLESMSRSRESPGTDHDVILCSRKALIIPKV